MTFPQKTHADWRAQVDKELAGKPFEKALVHDSLEGLAVQPLYTEAKQVPRALGDGAPFRICMQHAHDAKSSAIQADLDGGADALWLAAGVKAPAKIEPNVLVVADESETACTVNGTKVALVSTLAWHDAGADAAEEIALALAAAVERITAGSTSLLVRVAVGRDTFLELSKIRALRTCLAKVLAAFEGKTFAPVRIHAVCSTRTMTARDPWVNMLRVTTQTFAAILGGADLVTPNAFDRLLESPSDLGRRIARNTGHVLREESALGRVIDPGAGSYYFDATTDALAREAWTRFQAIEKSGGLTKCLENGSIDAKLAETRKKRQAQIASRKLPILGVSEFANLGEHLPSAPIASAPTNDLRDAAAFERLRNGNAHPEALLVTLGAFADSRARVGFASTFFAAGGIASRETTKDEKAAIACLCGSDDAYASEAVARAKALKAAGCKRVLLAGRPGALEADLRAAGVDGFVYVGCDALAVLSSLVEVSS